MSSYIITTGEHLVEDVKDYFECHTCEGVGVMFMRDPQMTEPTCLDCNGTGWRIQI